MGTQSGAGALSVAWTDLATRLGSPGEDAIRLHLRQLALTGAHPVGRLTLGWFVGAPMGGQLAFEDGPAPWRLRSGLAGGVGLTWPVWTTYDRPFALDLSAQLAASHTTLAPAGGGRDGTATALDVRLSATASRTFARNLAVWSAIRVFGGPLFVTRGEGATRETIIASDTRHVQLAAGLAFAPLGRLWPGLRLGVEGRAISEWGFGATLGVGL